MILSSRPGSARDPNRSADYENRDLAVTTDFRDVFAEILSKRMAIANLKPVFPGYPLEERKRFGLIA